jgi:hypothetical protein
MTKSLVWAVVAVLGLATPVLPAASAQPAPEAPQPPPAPAQDAEQQPASPPAGPSGGRLRVFLDCFPCFPEYLRTEIDWVDFVNQPQDAEVHAIGTVQGTGGGGRETFIRLVGMGRFQGVDRELRAVTVTGESEEVRRRAVLRAISAGLLSYLALEGLPENLEFEVEAPEAARAAQQTVSDAWNFWVFSLRGSASYSAEETSRESEWEASASGDRVTEEWKLAFGVSLEKQTERFNLDEDEPLRTTRESREVDWFAAKSLGPHWSFGLEGSVGSSTFGNTKFQAAAAPAIEFSVFPYQEYATRQLVAQYQVGVEHSRYNEVTLFDRLRETRPRHEVALRFDQRQTWGSMEAAVEYSQYLHDRSKYRLEVDGELSLRIVRGLSLDFGAEASRINDQLSQPRRSASQEEVLLRLRELQSDYELDFRISLTYSFGSLFNNVVNPRFPGGGGGGGGGGRGFN